MSFFGGSWVTASHIALVGFLKKPQKNKGTKSHYNPVYRRLRRIALIYINFLLRRKVYSSSIFRFFFPHLFNETPRHNDTERPKEAGKRNPITLSFAF